MKLNLIVSLLLLFSCKQNSSDGNVSKQDIYKYHFQDLEHIYSISSIIKDYTICFDSTQVNTNMLSIMIPNTACSVCQINLSSMTNKLDDFNIKYQVLYDYADYDLHSFFNNIINIETVDVCDDLLNVQKHYSHPLFLYFFSSDKEDRIFIPRLGFDDYLDLYLESILEDI